MTDARARVVAGLTGILTCRRTVLAGCDTAEWLAGRYPGETYGHGGESWTRFTRVPAEGDGFTIHFGEPRDELWRTVTIGQLADAVVAALGETYSRGTGSGGEPTVGSAGSGSADD